MIDALDGTDFAHPAWWRAHDAAFGDMCEHLRKILDGEDDGAGTCNEPWETLRRRVMALRQDALAEQVRVMREALEAVRYLTEDSDGVAGLHLNGDIAPWESLRTGGRFEQWLRAFDAALALTPTAAEQQAKANAEKAALLRAALIGQAFRSVSIPGHVIESDLAMELQTAQARIAELENPGRTQFCAMCEEKAKHIATLEAQLAEARKDGERWRWWMADYKRDIAGLFDGVAQGWTKAQWDDFVDGKIAAAAAEGEKG